MLFFLEHSRKFPLKIFKLFFLLYFIYIFFHINNSNTPSTRLYFFFFLIMSQNTDELPEEYVQVLEYVMEDDPFQQYCWEKSQSAEYCCPYNVWCCDLDCVQCGYEDCECGCQFLERCSNCQ
jgi:hypothetical protein